MEVGATIFYHRAAHVLPHTLIFNALDMCGEYEIGFEDGFFYVKDQGPGMDSGLFAINRPLKSSKYLRLPTRGALGNGLRVVAGAVAATGGRLLVATGGENYQIHCQNDGSALTERLGPYGERGTKISFSLGQTEIDPAWANLALQYARGQTCQGKTSPYWYTSENFFELFQAYSGSVRELIAQFDGCSGRITMVRVIKGHIVLKLTHCQSLCQKMNIIMYLRIYRRLLSR